MPIGQQLNVFQTEAFSAWLARLRDKEGTARIARRLVRIGEGNLGDVKSVGGEVSELRINYGPGYRLYFTRRGRIVVVLLCGGNKSTQAADIMMARKLTEQIEETDYGP